jgi:hypothetical protein
MPSDDDRRYLADALAAAEAAVRRARAARITATRRADQAITHARVRTSQVTCARCSPAAALEQGFPPALGEPCTCQVRCPRPGCLAGDGLNIPDAL